MAAVLQIYFFRRSLMVNAVGIDVSKGFSTVAVVDSLGKVMVSPFDVNHTVSELGGLADELKRLKGETKIIMEATGNYYLSIANTLHTAGLKVFAVNPILINDFGNNSIRKRESDKADARKMGRYAVDNWYELPPEYVPDDEIRHMLKAFSRQYSKYNKIKTMLKNNLISLLDQSFPGLNNLFILIPSKNHSIFARIFFVQQGGGRRRADARQGRQRGRAGKRPQIYCGFYLE
jgi:transposase